MQISLAKHSVAELAALTDHEIGKKGRIAQPVYLPKGATNYHAISWEDAFQKIAAALNRIGFARRSHFLYVGKNE